MDYLDFIYIYRMIIAYPSRSGVWVTGEGNDRYSNDLHPGITGCNLPQSNLNHIQAVKERKRERERESVWPMMMK